MDTRQPPTAPPRPQAWQWQVIGHSVRGAAHVRARLENQDAVAWLPMGGAGQRVALSIADGHGSPRSFRSAIGASLATAVAQEIAQDLLRQAPEGRELSALKDWLEEEAPRRIESDWRARVERHLGENPFSEPELLALEHHESGRSRQIVENDPPLAYGTTLISAFATRSFMAFWQIGDGDVMVVADDGRVEWALPRDRQLVGNETISLCTPDAWQHFRVALSATLSPLALVSTDGLFNSFADDPGFRKFGSDLHGLISAQGLEQVSASIDAWLDEMSTGGSGDDISLGVIWKQRTTTVGAE